ncbi:four-carbon acid sugar kinase family protein [Rathayibacter soli]|uniref:four-carbon acid sugar kinase family protein n=1 Tax=Rathayibacter soli TaxID=3144168 RepID=UPI0027E52AE9|nr:four-carbon acid sugar kinase family protein [Glaciibacter superstes]
MSETLLAFYGDDFTGSVDVLLQLNRAGLRGRLLLGLPKDGSVLAREARDVDAIGIAGLARSLPTGRLRAEVEPALRALGSLRPRVLQYKACSTADSSPDVGSIGRVIEIARDLTGRETIPVLFAQPDFGRFTVFGHHFATEAGVVYRLDRQPTMSHHPVTPMLESDLAAHLGQQTAQPISHIPFTEYTSAKHVAELLTESSSAAAVLDAITDEHLTLLGKAILSTADRHRPRFAIGSGGLTTALGRAFLGSRPHDETDAAGPAPHASGPVLVVSGSRSYRTAEQIEAARAAGWLVLPLALAHPQRAAVRAEVLEALTAGRDVVVSSSELEEKYSPDLVETIAVEAAALVSTALRAAVTQRVIVCGGDTSSRVLGVLGAEALSLAANPVENVVLCRVHSPHSWLDGVEILLKGGQVGPVGLFELLRGPRGHA